MKEIVGKWAQEAGQPYAGLWFDFKEDGTFIAQYDAMGIVSAGTYHIEGSSIDVNQTSHTFGLVGEFKGLFKIEGDHLKLALASGSEQPRPSDLEEARRYIKN